MNHTPFYAHLASLIDARANCARVGNSEWYERHQQRADALVREYCPSGSGWDLGTRLDWDRCTGDRIVLFGEWHHMNEGGYYDGWTAHSVTVRPSLAHGCTISVSGRNRNDIKEYLTETFFHALFTNIGPRLERERLEIPRRARTRKNYFKLRASGWRAVLAFDAAKTEAEWFDYECGEHDAPEVGAVRLRVVADESADFDDLCGDVFNPDVNHDIPRARLDREREEYREQINRDGVWGIIGEWFDGHKWQHADSCFGFVGEQWRGSGTDTDIMRATLELARAAREHSEVA